MEDETETVSLDLMLEVRVRHREDPIFFPLRLDVTPDVASVKDVMEFAHEHIAGILNRRDADHLLVMDTRFGHHIIMRDDIQTLSILAPDEASIPWANEEDEVEE